MKREFVVFLGLGVLSIAVGATGCGGGGGGEDTDGGHKADGGGVRPDGANSEDSGTTPDAGPEGDASPSMYTVGGSVTGLPSGESVVLRDNGGDDLTVQSNGPFTFATPLADGSAYAVTVGTQPQTATCTVSDGSGTISGANVTSVSVACRSITIRGTVQDDDYEALYLAGVTIEARNPDDDSVINSATTDAHGAYSLTLPPNRDFYLHATGATVDGTTYVSINYQIESETADSTVDFSLLNVPYFTEVAASFGIDPVNDGVFGIDVENSNGDGVAGVTVSVSPAVSHIWYQQGDGSFSETGPTTEGNGPSVVGNVASIGANATYTFTLDPDQATAGYTVDTTFRLRLVAGELSLPLRD